MALKQQSALAAFRLILADYERLLEFVHPDRANLSTYSHRAYELLLRSCTEFEALAKVAATEANVGAATSIDKMAPLAEHFSLDAVEVGNVLWMPDPLVLSPLRGWTRSPHELHWYRAYNSVKHNRVEQFDQASLSNVSSAIAACFAMLVVVGGVSVDIRLHEHLPGQRVRFSFEGFPFTIAASDHWQPFGIEFAPEEPESAT